MLHHLCASYKGWSVALNYLSYAWNARLGSFILLLRSAKGFSFAIPKLSLQGNVAAALALIVLLKNGMALFNNTPKVRSRCALRSEIWSAISRWETTCVREALHCAAVGECYFADDIEWLKTVIGEESACLVQNMWKYKWTLNHVSGHLSKFASVDFDIEKYIQLSFSAHSVFQHEADKLLLQRLDFVIQFAIFRRLSCIQEYRYAKSLNLSESAPSGKETDVWRLCGSPSWILPLYEDAFVCLPPSYFPVESIMTHTANWLRLDELRLVIPKWKKENQRFLRLLPTVVSQWEHSREGNSNCKANLAFQRRAAQSVICFWFYRHGNSLYDSYSNTVRQSTNQFYYQMLFNNRFFSVRSLRRSSARYVGLVMLNSFCTMMNVALQFWSARIFFDYTCSAAAFISYGSTNQFLRRTVWSAVFSSTAGVFSVFLRHIQKSVTQKLSVYITGIVREDLSLKLSSADHAFVSRLTTPSTRSTAFFRGAQSLAGLSKKATMSGECIVSKFETTVRKWSTVLFLTGTAWHRQNFGALLIAAFFARCASSDVASKASIAFRFTEPRDIRLFLQELPLPNRCGFGVSLLIDVLAEKFEEEKEYPALSFVACCDVWKHDWLTPPLKEIACLNSESKSKLLDRSRKVCNYYKWVCSFNTATLSFNCARSLLEQFQVTVSFIYNSSVIPAADRLSRAVRCTIEDSQRSSLTHLHDLDPEERCLASEPCKLEYLPPCNGFESFARKPFFLMKQMGLTTLMAHKLVQAQENTDEFSFDMFEFEFENPFAFLLCQCFQLAEAVAITAAATLRVLRSSSIPWIRFETDYKKASFLSPQSESIAFYKRSIQKIFFDPHQSARVDSSLFALHELLNELPSSIGDNAPLSTSRLMKRRRKMWREYLKLQGRSLRYDEYHRIIGGLSLSKGIQLHNIHFAYPDIYHFGRTREGDCEHPRTLLLKLALRDVSASFPSSGMSAVIGRTASGKSTLFQLLKRIYEPLPVISRAGLNSTRFKDMHWTFEMLKEIWFLSVTHVLPLPPPMEERNGQFYLKHRSYITFDGIPAACFSVAYQRQWLVQMEQIPTMLQPGTTFEDNIRFLFSAVRRCDIAQAVTNSQSEFINEKPLKTLSKVGTLSGGEQQRLGLARALAASSACQRHYRLSLSYSNSKASTTASVVALLLDEPTSRLDAHNERKVEEAMNSLIGMSSLDATARASMITIIIAHRLTTVQAAKHVVVIDDGRMEAEGSLDSVIKQSSFAKRQAELQFVPLGEE